MKFKLLNDDEYCLAPDKKFMNRKRIYLFGLIGGLGVASSDVYISCLPELSILLNINPHVLQLTFSGYFFAMALSSLIYSVLLNYISKRIIFLTALMLFCGATFSLAYIIEAYQMWLARLLQGISFGFIQPLLLASLKEQNSTNVSQSMASYSAASEALSVLLPLIGASSFTYLSWRSPFIIVSLIAFLLLVSTKNIMPVNKPTLNSQPLLHHFRAVIKNYDFIKFNIISFFMIGLGWSIISISAYILDNSILHGCFYTSYGILYVSGNIICERMWLSKKEILGVFPILLAAVAFLICYGLMIQNTKMLVFAMLLFGGLSGLVYGPIIDQALNSVRDSEVNAASSLVVFVRLLGSFIFITASSYFYSLTTLYYIVMLILSFASLIFISLLPQSRLKPGI